MESISSFNEFWDTFKLPIVMSLLGALIGHYRKNGVISWPIFSISYNIGPYADKIKGRGSWLIRYPYIAIDFLFYIVGIHIGKKREAVTFDLGFFGDFLVGIGAGILAKVTIELADIENEFALISSALLAGFAGMSYMLKFQNEAEKEWEKDGVTTLETANVTDSPASNPSHTQIPNQAERESASTHSNT